MPVEIRELVFTATLVQDGKNIAADISTAYSLENNVSGNEQTINLCVEKIIEILKDKYER